MLQSQRFIDDLIWTINSPLLVDLTKLGVLHPIQESEIDKARLTDFMQKRITTRVGRYFENLVHFWIACHQGHEVIAHSLPIYEGKRTLGEIDFVFRDDQGELNHWEVACKFYLQNDKDGEFIGPNSRDTLRNKLARMVEHQLPLGKTQFPEIAKQHTLIKGLAFYHWQNTKPLSLGFLNRLHLNGIWMRAHESQNYLTQADGLYRVLKKPHWLAEERPDNAAEGPWQGHQTASMVDAHFARDSRPLLLCKLPSDKDTLPEIARVFIVNNNWPEPEK